jgi:hypothetical protein
MGADYATLEAEKPDVFDKLPVFLYTGCGDHPLHHAGQTGGKETIYYVV